MARKRDFGLQGIFSEYTQTAQIREAMDIAQQLIDEGYQAKVTRVVKQLPIGPRTYYVVWQRGKPSRKGRVALGVVETFFGPQRRVL